jgi:hypothetical protein
VSALTNAADIRRYVLRAGGQVRVLTLSENPQTLATAAFQLDDNLDLGQTPRNSLVTAAKLSREPCFSYRQLPVNPGFSLVIVNADEPDGYVIFESHGFRDDNIADRTRRAHRDGSPTGSRASRRCGKQRSRLP